MNPLVRHHVTFGGRESGPTLLLAHGFGCDQHMWRSVTPFLEDDHRLVLFDYVGAGASVTSAYDPARYASLEGYADDVIEICEALGLSEVVFVGHSVSAMIGALAAGKRPDLFTKLVMVSPSARYIDDGEYVGGFSQADIDELLDSMDRNYLGWSRTMAPVIMANGDRPELAGELHESFCRSDPTIAKAFANVTFRSDNRQDLAAVRAPTLVLQSREDLIAPQSAGEYVRDHLREVDYVVLDTTGHCPHLSAPAETAAAIRSFLGSGAT
ncbi:MAG: alpha/beta hydrolase [Aeromicrobium sp.]|uniref:alpha/beta fold hydrolase n=1 Tax=Aeromicrobium sp. TaxID=1871063 RepID=UPI00261A9DC2|nr:alpha/beta hydrolase [Aeromicrobium sp.]MCW2825854.1 alpha/beta hydrolase [Aeromicrobium sp.]